MTAFALTLHRYLAKFVEALTEQCNKEVCFFVIWLLLWSSQCIEIQIIIILGKCLIRNWPVAQLQFSIFTLQSREMIAMEKSDYMHCTQTID